MPRLTYMQQRYYDPQIGRFLTVDPVAADAGSGFNRYDYANDNPYRFTDPDGRMSAEEAKDKSERARARRERHEANERAAHTGLTAGGSRDSVRTGPSQPTGNIAKQISAALNVVNGARLAVAGFAKVGIGSAATATGVGTVPGAVAVGIGTWNIRGAGKALDRAAQQWAEAPNEDTSNYTRGDYIRTVLAGVMPYGTEVDDPGEPTPAVFYQKKAVDAMNHPAQILSELSTLGF